MFQLVAHKILYKLELLENSKKRANLRAGTLVSTAQLSI